MTKIFLVRHAEAEGNIYRRAHGHYNGLITVRGHKQIELLKKRFLDEQIDAVYSSDLSRAVTTAKAVSGPRNMQIITERALREVDMGSWEDRTWGEISYNEPEMNFIFNNDPAKWRVDGGEPYENVYRRVYDFIAKAAKEHDGGTIAVFSHGFAIRTFFCRVQGIPSHETDSVPYYDNTAVTLLTFDGGAFTIEYAGDNSHLGVEDSTLQRQSWWRPEDKRVPENLRFLPLGDAASEPSIKAFREKVGEAADADAQYAAFLTDEPVGILGLDTRRGADKGIGLMSYIFVTERHRRKTYGVQLVGLAISECRKLRRSKLRIELPCGRPGLGFLKKCGFSGPDGSAAGEAACVMDMDIKNW